MKLARNKKGFTLIELMVVVLIIGVLAALAIPRFTKASLKAKLAEPEMIIKQIYTLNIAFYQLEGHNIKAYRITDGTHYFDNDSKRIADSLGFSIPTGTPRFDYYTRADGSVVALPNGTDDFAVNDLDSVFINKKGDIHIAWK
ncbi:prepilin-type N-terminal cleavage/methylation domain-containing protein [bacterium]|nr:prepilin-type N-terminal cleavage/methylation domain-containing protein [bacterium]